MNKTQWNEHIERGTLPKGTRYYTPDIHAYRESYAWRWDGDAIDISRMRLGLVCRTKSEAVKLAQWMLAVAREAR